MSMRNCKQGLAQNIMNFSKILITRPQLEEIKTELKQANRLFSISAELPIKLAIKKDADIWEKANEPFNVKLFDKEN